MTVNPTLPFVGTRKSAAGMISVKLPSDDWLCYKLEKFNLTLTEGYPVQIPADSVKISLSKFLSLRDGMMCPPKRKTFSKSKIHYLQNELAKRNSAFPRIAKT